MAKKVCKTCGKLKPQGEYKPNPNLKLGYELHCNDCRLSKRRKHYVENHDVYLAYARQYREQEWVKKRIAKYNKEYYSRPDVREKNNAWHVEYRNSNPEVKEYYRKYQREYYKKNREKVLERVKKAQAKKKKSKKK